VSVNKNIPESELSVGGQNDEETHGIRLLLLAVVLVGAVSVLVPSIPKQWKVEIDFLPPLLIGLVALVLLFNLRLAAQRKSLRKVSNALIAATSYIDRLEHFSFLDPETQLFNRRYLDQLFSQQASSLNRSGHPATLVLIAVRPDERKVANESVIIKAAFVLRSNFRGSDYIVRCSLNQFLVVLPDTDEPQAQIALNRLAEKVEYWNLENESTEMVLRYERTVCPPGANLWEKLREVELKLETGLAPVASEFMSRRVSDRRSRPALISPAN
jgi:diguanylate cyclase (GGDEF)-like protein